MPGTSNRSCDERPTRICNSPYGLWEELVFSSLPYIYDHFEPDECSIVLVVTPLMAIMKDQVSNNNFKKVEWT